MKENNCAFIHGDCWSNNIMFKYDDLDKERPQAILIFDLQMSRLGSPVLDLAYHLYATSSDEDLNHFKDLLRIYYSSLSITIRQLGSDPEKLFPYEELVRQWRKYSACSLILLLLANEGDVLDIQDLNADAITKLIERAKVTKEDLASPRLIAVIKHFPNYDNY